MVVTCRECGKQFTRIFNLNRHFLTKHSNNADCVEKCMLCHQIFQSCDELQNHYKIYHTASNKFVEKQSAFKKNFITYRYVYEDDNTIGFSASQAKVRNLLRERLISETLQKKICKVNLIFICEMFMTDTQGNTISSASVPFQIGRAHV